MPKARLVELYAHGLGVIDDARVEFGPGFNALTGETGAGKTLLLGALELSLGGGVSASRYAVTADTRAVALFVLDNDQEITFSREATSGVRLRSTLNGAPSSVDALRTLAESMIVIHGQHDSLALRQRGEIVRLIDRHGGVDTRELDSVRQATREARRRVESFGGDKSARQREREFLEFQMKELDDGAIVSEDELAGVLEELTRLTTLRAGQAALEESLDRFDAEGEDAILTQYARALGRLPSGDAYESVRDSLNGALLQAREALGELAALGDADAFDQGTLDALDVRAGVLQQLARKYGGTLASALHARGEIQSQYDTLVAETSRLDRLDEEIRDLDVRERRLSDQARKERQVAAATLSAAVLHQLERVALPNATLSFVAEGDDGSDARISFAPNPGRPEGPLADLASGGELSRVLLAISLETADDNLVAVFDEIDAGLGGQVAQEIGQCLVEVGQRQQVLAITHLASVAARANHHFVIEKMVDHGVTSTSVREVVGDERVREIARMLAGDGVTRESQALAQQLLQNGFEVRSEADFSR